MPASLSIDLRQRILAAYDAKEGSQRQLDISKNSQTSSVPNFVASGGFRQLSEVQR